MNVVRDARAERQRHAGGAMSNPRRSGGGDEIPPTEVWRSIKDIEYSHHFIRLVAILELEREGEWPINSSSVRTRVKEMTGADEKPTTKSVLTSMHHFKDLGALTREEVEAGSGFHWTSTERGREFGRVVGREWCWAFGFDEAAAALEDDSDSDSIDSDE